MSAEQDPPRLFLYGSLLTGTRDRLINKQVRRLLRHAPIATIQARLYNLGPYPGVVPSAAATERVYGRVINLAKPCLLRQLDRYEEYFIDEPAKSEFIRILMPAQLLPSRKRFDCWVYVYNDDISGKQHILSGDYVRYKRSRQRW